MTVLIDTNVLLAYAFARDNNHAAASRIIHAVETETRIVVAPVLTELFYLTMVRISYERAVELFARTRRAFDVHSLTVVDLDRMQEIMRQYQDAAFDFTDVAIMAVAERLNISRICTFDRRDFSIMRPRHCAYFELLP